MMRLQNDFGATKFSIWELIPLGAAGRRWSLLGTFVLILKLLAGNH